MNPDFDDHQLESEIDRHLKGLPDLVAPRSLAPRTMQMIARPAAEWHSRSWATWPASIRAAYAVVAMALLAATVPGLQAFEQGVLAPIFTRFAHWGAGVAWLWNAGITLANAGADVVNHAGKGIIVPCVLAMVLAYTACIGFGTVFVKLAFAGPKKS